MTWAWDQQLKLGPKFVLVALADHSDGAGVCWPGHELIAEKCNITRQTVVEHIAFLERENYLRAERTRTAKGREGKARYFLNLDRLSTQAPESEKPTLARVGISAIPESGLPDRNKVEPKAIEPNPQPPCLFAVTMGELNDWFDRQFWPLYPKRVGRGKALQVLREQPIDRVTLDAILGGLKHRLAAEAAATARGDWFRDWPDAHRWLKASERRWEDRFDVPRETLRDESKCHRCGAPAVAVHNGKPHCRDHNPVFESDGARA